MRRIVRDARVRTQDAPNILPKIDALRQEGRTDDGGGEVGAGAAEGGNRIGLQTGAAEAPHDHDARSAGLGAECPSRIPQVLLRDVDENTCVPMVVVRADEGPGIVPGNLSVRSLLLEAPRQDGGGKQFPVG
eukprot:334586_1